MNNTPRHSNKPGRWLVLGAGLCLAAQAAADEYHYNNIIVGERASGMGGAYTAVSDDVSGLYYNPAGIVYGQSSNISASVNAYHTANKTYADALAGALDWERSSATLLPNFFGIVQPLGKGAIGLSYAVPDAITENQDQTFSNPSPSELAHVINYNDTDRTYLIGPSYAQELAPGLALGATVYFHYRERQWILNELATNTLNQTQLANTYFEISEVGLRPQLGLMWSPAKRLSLGMSLGKTTVLDSNAERQSLTKDYTASAITRSVIETDEKRELPLTTAVGVAWFPSSRLLLSGDLTHFGATDDAFGETVSVVNFAMGGEYYLSETLALRAGLFSNYANTPTLSASGTGQREHIDYLGGSASLSRFTRNSTVTLGVSYSYGSGEAQVVCDPQENPTTGKIECTSTDIQDVTAQSFTVLLSTSYTY